MPVLTGIDLVEIERIKAGIERTPRFRDRVFTPQEITYCEARGRGRFASYAARFAAKEAAFKALGTGLAQGVTWHDAEICSCENGMPVLRLTGEAHERYRAFGGKSISVSLTHTIQTAGAVVCIEATGGVMEEKDA